MPLYKKNPRITITPAAFKALTVQAALQGEATGDIASRMILAAISPETKKILSTKGESLQTSEGQREKTTKGVDLNAFAGNDSELSRTSLIPENEDQEGESLQTTEGERERTIEGQREKTTEGWGTSTDADLVEKDSAVLPKVSESVAIQKNVRKISSPLRKRPEKIAKIKEIWIAGERNQAEIARQVDEDKDAVNRWIVKALERGELQP